MATLTHLASRYRWELILFVGIPFIERTSRWFFIKILANFNLSLPDLICHPQICTPDYVPTFFSMWLPLLLVYLYYFRVRHLGRPILSLLWAYAFVSTTVGTVTSLPHDVIGIEWRFRAPWSWLDDIQTLIQLFILMWFARQASRISFGHALVLIGLSNFLFEFGLVMANLVFAQLEDWTPAWDIAAFALASTLFALWMLTRLDLSKEKHETDIERWLNNWDIPASGAALRRLAVRVLPRFDPAKGISKELLVALFGLNWLLHAFLSLRIWVVSDIEPGTLIEAFVVPVFVYWPLLIVLVILLAYGVRVRQLQERSPAPESTATV